MRPASTNAIEPPVAAVGGGGECGEAVWVGGEDIGGKVAIDKRARGGDVFFEKGAGGKAGGGRGDVDVLVVVDTRQRGDGGKAHIDANGSIERGGHRDVHMALAQVLGHLEDAAHAAKRGGFDHSDVRGLQFGHAIRVGDFTDGFIGGDANEEAGAHKAATDLGKLLSGGTGLFHIIQRHHHLRGLDRLIDAPATVGVHAQDRDIAALGDGVADGADASGVVGKRVPLLRYFDFEGAAAGVALHHGRNLAGGYGRDGGVDLDGIAHRLREALVGGLEPGAQPCSGLGRAILQEGRELAPAGRPLDEQSLPSGNAAETHGEREGDYVGAVEDVIDMHGLHGSARQPLTPPPLCAILRTYTDKGGIMLLAEALAERAQAQERLNSLHERLLTVARVQEGDTPDEDPQELLRELDGVAGRIDELVQAINATNIATAFDKKMNLMEALALRDGLLRKRRIYHDLAQRAGTRSDRYSRTEIKFVSTIPVADLRKRVDDLSKQYRELDTRIQQLNWNTELKNG